MTRPGRGAAANAPKRKRSCRGDIVGTNGGVATMEQRAETLITFRDDISGSSMNNMDVAQRVRAHK